MLLRNFVKAFRKKIMHLSKNMGMSKICVFSYLKIVPTVYIPQSLKAKFSSQVITCAFNVSDNKRDIACAKNDSKIYNSL